jgi:hypothetical protein
MKFSITSTLLLANGIAAMPWSSLNAKQSNGEEITYVPSQSRSLCSILTLPI